MSREIRFRAWDKAQKRYIDINGLSLGFVTMPNKGCLYGVTEQGVLREYDVSEVDIEQWIGFTDKNGKDVFEGHIIKWYSGSISTEGLPDNIVKQAQQSLHEWLKKRDGDYDYEANGWYKKYNIKPVVRNKYNYLTPEGHNPFGSMYLKPEEIEVIGTIHENPELLK